LKICRFFGASSHFYRDSEPVAKNNNHILTKRSSHSRASIPQILLIILCFSAPLMANVDLDPNAELVLDLRLDGQRLGTDILGYQHEGSFFISLTELTESLQFPIRIDADAGLAGGWYINEDREFFINVAENRVVSGSKAFTLNPETFSIKEDDFFIETTILEEWFPLELQTAIRQLTLNVSPTETIPLQERMARMSRGPIGTTMTTNEPQMPPLKDPYQFIGHRGTDLRLGYTANQPEPDAETRRNYNYSLLSRGDLGWMTSTFFASGSDSDNLSNARLTLERTRFDGPLQLNHVEIGDVRSGGGNRGVLVRGGVAQNQYQGQFADDTIPIRGNILPDWEVELYRNGVLIDFQIVGSDGRYNFPEVPLVYGENVFELRFYGPFGEERQEQVTQYVGEGMFGLGSFSYELSATQADQTVLGLEDPSESEDQGSGIYSARASIGLTRSLTATGTINSFQRNGNRLESYSAGLSLSAFRAQTSASYRYNPEGLDTASASITSRTGFLGWGANYQHFLTDRLYPEEIPDNRPLWQTGLNLNLRQFAVPFSLNLRHTEQKQSEISSADLSYTARLPYNSRFSQNVAWVRTDNRKLGGTLDRFITTGVSISTSTGPWNLRLNSNFFLKPETDLAGLSGSARVRLDRTMAITFDARYQPSLDTTSYSAGYNWLFETLMLSPRLSYDTNERWGGSISLSTSFGTRPYTYEPYIDRLSQTDHGGVASRVFMDMDNNGIFDPSDTPISGARVFAPQGFRSGSTNADGAAYLPRLSAYRTTDIILDRETLPDLDMTPTHKGNSVTPRPGHWNTIDFPVIRTMELEGTVFRITPRGDQEPVGRVSFQLIDGEGEVVAQQRTAFDGMFIYTNVPPGTFRLQPTDTTRYEVISGPGSIEVLSNGGILRELDFVVREQRESTESLIPQSENVPTMPDAQRPAIVPLDPEIIESTPLPAQSPSEGQSEASKSPTLKNQGESNEQWLVQFGAFGQPGNAEDLWGRLKNEIPELFSNRKAVFRELEGRGLTALMTIIQGEESDADKFCANVKQQNFACIVKGRN
jgi:sporulation related protein